MRASEALAFGAEMSRGSAAQLALAAEIGGYEDGEELSEALAAEQAEDAEALPNFQFAADALRKYAEALRSGALDGAGHYLPDQIEEEAEKLEDMAAEFAGVDPAEIIEMLAAVNGEDEEDGTDG